MSFRAPAIRSPRQCPVTVLDPVTGRAVIDITVTSPDDSPDEVLVATKTLCVPARPSSPVGIRACPREKHACPSQRKSVCHNGREPFNRPACYVPGSDDLYGVVPERELWA